MSDWTRVTKRNRCPICEHDSWCSVSSDGELVCCMRATEGGKPIETRIGVGRLIRLREPIVPAIRPRPSRPRKPVNLLAYYRSVRGHLRRKTYAGINAEVWDTLDAGETADGHLAVPMFNSRRQLVGIRIRAMRPDKDGRYRKWAIASSTNGLFMPRTFYSTDGPLLVCEGPTDTACALDYDYDAIGRASVSTATDWACRVARGRDVVLIEDRDAAGSTAAKAFERFVTAMTGSAKSVRIVTPRKDLRAAFLAGKSRRWLRAQIANGSYVR